MEASLCLEGTTAWEFASTASATAGAHEAASAAASAACTVWSSCACGNRSEVRLPRPAKVREVRARGGKACNRSEVTAPFG